MTEIKTGLQQAIAYEKGFAAGKQAGLDLVFDRLKEDLKGYIGLNYLEDLRKKYKETIC
jgi:hypothetical protein